MPPPHPRPRLLLKTGSRFLFLSKQARDPGALQQSPYGQAWQPLGFLRVLLVEVGAGAAATACRFGRPWPSVPCTQSLILYCWPRRQKTLEDVEQGGADKESPD